MQHHHHFSPGIYDGLDEESYLHARGVSNSDLRSFSMSPLHYQRSLLAPPIETDAMLIGKLLHRAILEPARFSEGVSHFVKPEGMKFSTKEGKAWRDEHAALPIIGAADDRHIAGAMRAVHAVPQAAALLAGRGSNECTVFAEHPRTGLTLRMRADRLTEDGAGRPWIVDIKSCPDVRRFALTARDLRYDVQGVFYPDVLALAGQPFAAFVFIAVELEPTHGIHGVRLVMLDEDTQSKARLLYESELDRWAECERTGVWPGYPEDIEYLSVRRWAA